MDEFLEMCYVLLLVDILVVRFVELGVKQAAVCPVHRYMYMHGYLQMIILFHLITSQCCHALAVCPVVQCILALSSHLCRLHRSNVIVDLVSNIRDNFGDSHELVRDLCMDLLLYLADEVSTPQTVWDHVASGLSHRIPRVRQYCLIFFEKVVSKHSQRSIQVRETTAFG